MMAGVVSKSTQYLTEQDLMAIAEYLKTHPPSNDEGPGNADSAMQASASSAATRALSAGDTGMRGSRVYLDNCNACHQLGWFRRKTDLPESGEKRSGQCERPISLIHIVLAGGPRRQRKQRRPRLLCRTSGGA